MKKLLFILGIFAFMTVMAASSSTKNCSGRLVDQNSRPVSQAIIECQETGHSVSTNIAGSFSNLQVEPNTTNTLTFSNSSGQYLGSQEIEVGSSDISGAVLQTGSMSR